MKQVTEEKLHKIMLRQQIVEEMQSGIAHSMKCLSQEKTIDSLPQMYYFCMPYKGPQTGNRFQAAMVHLIRNLESEGFRAGYSNGILWMVQGGQVKSYVYIDMKETDKCLENYPQIIKSPAGQYLCLAREESSIENARELFAEQFAQNYDMIIIETELFAEKFRYTKPTFELRCYLGEKR